MADSSPSSRPRSGASRTPRSPRPSRSPVTAFLIRWFLRLAAVGGALALCAALLGCIAYAVIWPKLPDLHAMTDYRPRVPLRIYSADHVLLGEFGEERRRVLSFDQIPAIMKQALLSAEDADFYKHGGIAWTGVLRASLTNLANMDKAEGASTITMQVARNFYLTSRKTWSRKFYELLLTFKIEQELSKDQILDLYMNQVYLGNRVYGFAAASQRYFGKPLETVTPAEAAMLAGIPKAPSRNNPINNLESAIVRQHYVLGRMKANGYLNDTQYQQALAEPMTSTDYATQVRHSVVYGQYVAEMARQMLYNVYGDDIYTRGLSVYTTVLSTDQQAAYEAVRTGVLQYTQRTAYPGPRGYWDLPAHVDADPIALTAAIGSIRLKYPDDGELLTGVVLSASPDKLVVARDANQTITLKGRRDLARLATALSPRTAADHQLRRGAVVYLYQSNGQWTVMDRPTVQAALVSIAPKDGAILALIGGYEFTDGDFNRATQAWRQPGSNMKPFIYAAALERGVTPATRISNQAFSLTAAQTGSKPWDPKNYGGETTPVETMRNGLYQSINLVTIRIMQAIGPHYAQSFITRFGFDKSRQPAVLPMALGAGTVTPLQLAGAYSVFANGGYRVGPYLISRVLDSEGKELMHADPVDAGDEAARAVDPRTIYVMDDLLRGVAHAGTGARAGRELGRADVGGKTGTTNQSVDAWFSGFTPDVEATAWLGYDQPKSLGARETGGGVALPIWLAYMKTALKGVPQRPIPPMPPGLSVIDGNYYLSEWPPGRALTEIGLAPSAPNGDSSDRDALGKFLDNLLP